MDGHFTYHNERRAKEQIGYLKEPASLWHTFSESLDELSTFLEGAFLLKTCIGSWVSRRLFVTAQGTCLGVWFLS